MTETLHANLSATLQCCRSEPALAKRGTKPRRNNVKLVNKTRLIIHTVALVFQVTPEQIRSRSRENARSAFARQVAMYLTHICCGLSYSETGRLFHRDRTTVAHACALVEDSRDDRNLDQTLCHTETAVTRLINATSTMENATQ